MAEKCETYVNTALTHAAGVRTSYLDQLGSAWSVLDFLGASLVQFRNAGVVFYEVLPLQ